MGKPKATEVTNQADETAVASKGKKIPFKPVEKKLPKAQAVQPVINPLGSDAEAEANADADLDDDEQVVKPKTSRGSKRKQKAKASEEVDDSVEAVDEEGSSYEKKS
jgi:hypothetical protein